MQDHTGFTKATAVVKMVGESSNSDRFVSVCTCVVVCLRGRVRLFFLHACRMECDDLLSSCFCHSHPFDPDATRDITYFLSHECDAVCGP